MPTRHGTPSAVANTSAACEADLRLVACSMSQEPDTAARVAQLLLVGTAAPAAGQMVALELICHQWRLRLIARVATRSSIRAGFQRSQLDILNPSREVLSALLRLATLGDARHIRAHTRTLSPAA